MFWAFILLCLSVGPPYCLHMRVKFYSSEPNNLHEELTRWIAKSLFFSLSEWILQLLHACFYRSVECFVCVLYAMKLPKFYFSFPCITFLSFFQVSICATVEARRPQWEVSIFCIVIAFCPIHRTSFIKCYTQKCCICWETVGFSRVELFSVHLLYIYKHYKTLRNVKYSSY